MRGASAILKASRLPRSAGSFKPRFLSYESPKLTEQGTSGKARCELDAIVLPLCESGFTSTECSSEYSARFTLTRFAALLDTLRAPRHWCGTLRVPCSNTHTLGSYAMLPR